MSDLLNSSFSQIQRALRSFMEEKVPKFNEEMREGTFTTSILYTFQ